MQFPVGCILNVQKKMYSTLESTNPETNKRKNVWYLYFLECSYICVFFSSVRNVKNFINIILK